MLELLLVLVEVEVDEDVVEDELVVVLVLVLVEDVVVVAVAVDVVSPDLTACTSSPFTSMTKLPVCTTISTDCTASAVFITTSITILPARAVTLKKSSSLSPWVFSIKFDFT